MNLHWLEQREVDVPSENNWLNASETVVLDRLHFAKRRADWRLGRWTAKRTVAACLGLPDNLETLADIEVRAAASGAPEVFLREIEADVAISLSHRFGTALCALGPADAQFGCDLELIEPRTDGFVTDYFTASEQALIAHAPHPDRQRLVTLIWSAKESALKAIQLGLRADTNCVSVSFAGSDFSPEWNSLRVCYQAGQEFCGWWRAKDLLVRTVVSTSPIQIPSRPLTQASSGRSETFLCA